MSSELERKRIAVGLVDIGEQLPVKLAKLCKILNRRQHDFRFSKLGCITAAVLGKPDVQDRAYNAARLHQLLRESSFIDECSYLVGMTHVLLAAKPSGARKFDIPYFSLSDFSKVAVICLHPSVASFRGPTASIYQYLAYLLMCELLIMLAKEDLSHTDEQRCLFDDCVDRTALGHCIGSGTICPASVAKLKRLNVSNDSIQAAQAVLNWCRRSLLPFVVRFSLTHPVSTFSLGTGLGWYLSATLQREAVWTVFALAMAPAVIIASYVRFRTR